MLKPHRQAGSHGKWLPDRGEAGRISDTIPRGGGRRQSDPQQLGLGHVSEDAQGSGHPAGQLGIDGSRLDAPLDQVHQPQGNLAVEGMERLAPQVLRQGTANLDHPPRSARRAERQARSSRAEPRIRTGRRGLCGRPAPAFLKGQGDPAQGWHQVLLDQVSGTPGRLGSVDERIERSGTDAEELAEDPAARPQPPRVMIATIPITLRSPDVNWASDTRPRAWSRKRPSPRIKNPA